MIYSVSRTGTIATSSQSKQYPQLAVLSALTLAEEASKTIDLWKLMGEKSESRENSPQVTFDMRK